MMDKFQLAFAAIFLTGLLAAMGHRYYAARRGGAVSEKQEQDAVPLTYIALRLGGLVLWGMAIAYALNPAWVQWASFSIADGFRWLGAGVAAAMIPLMLWAMRVIGGNVTRTVAVRAEHELVTTGPYVYMRHPLYTFGLLFFSGLGLLAANMVILALTFVTVFAVNNRLPHEEAALIERFGDDYRAYAARTGRFLPKL
jgi:protein-S-isoprenylcysteine O-methyltransferase Ste14